MAGEVGYIDFFKTFVISHDYLRYYHDYNHVLVVFFMNAGAIIAMFSHVLEYLRLLLEV